MKLNEIGQIVADEWRRSPEIRQEIELDEWPLMPNHIHGIVVINEFMKPIQIVGANGRGASRTYVTPLQTHMKPRSLASLIAGFKSATTKRINIIRNSPRIPIWQRNYYDHVIRDESAFQTIRQYIQNNSLSWELDQLHPKNSSK